MIGFYNYTVILTYISLISSFIGITQLFKGNFLISVFCLIISGGCDMFDGPVARSCKNRTEQAKTFGIQIDSLCDLVCFGVFPAILNYAYTTSINDKLTIPAVAVGALFLLGALIRLGYFNVMEQERQMQTTDRREYYQGLPVTSVALFLPIVFIFRNIFPMTAYSYFLNIFMLGMAVFFIMNIKIKKPHGLYTIVLLAISLIMIIVLALQGAGVLCF